MNVLFVSAEATPFAKVGGLADVAGSLPVYLGKLGVDARLIMPKYRVIPQDIISRAEYVGYTFVQLGWRRQYAGLFKLAWRGITVYFVDNEYYFGADRVYGYYEGEAEKYAFFCKAVLELLPLMGFTPDVLHCNDWQAGLLPVLLATQYTQYRIATVVTIHNLKYQGVYGIELMKDLLGFDDSMFTMDKLEFYGNTSFLKAGIVYANKINTVSTTYAVQTLTPEYGECLDGVLASRYNDYSGIVNGIDYEEWNPQTDSLIAAPFTGRGFAGKAVCKKEIQKELGLEICDKPLIAFIGRLYDQKGLSMIKDMLYDLLNTTDMQFAVLGTGDGWYENFFRQAECDYRGRVNASICFDNAHAHRLYAGADFLLMPSAFEPCGLTQLIAMRYGCLPIVRATGGLKDTVLEHTLPQGNGFVFYDYDGRRMADSIRDALAVYNDKQRFTAMRKNAAKADWSWDKSARQYIELYNSCLK